jgi:hypothetical protein
MSGMRSEGNIGKRQQGRRRKVVWLSQVEKRQQRLTMESTKFLPST